MKKILVIGLGMSGQAAVEFLLKQGEQVVGLDANPKVEARAGFEVYHDKAELDYTQFKQAILSPGVPPTHPQCAKIREHGIELIGEAELAFRLLKQPCLGITGTNGKTTVTLLTEHVLKSCGIKARALGNVGAPLITYMLNPDPEEIIVAELSSYQLETMTVPVFDAGVILNVTPDHLDRYADIEEYAQAKCRLQYCLKKEAPLFVYEKVMEEYGYLLMDRPVITYGNSEQSQLQTDKRVLRQREHVEVVLPEQYNRLGMHESENVLAVWTLCRPFGVTPAQFCSALATFEKPAHRIQFVKEIGGVTYYDDSKGTNIDAVIQAVGAMHGPIILIAGGLDKGTSYAPWKESFANRVKQIIALGQAAEKIAREMGNFFPVEIVASLSDAVQRAEEIAERGDCVLLSPGCASWDMFRDYAHRGELFQQYVNHLLEEEEKIT